MAEGKIKIKLVRSVICSPQIARFAYAEPDGGAPRYAGVSRHGEEGAAPAPDCERLDLSLKPSVSRKLWFARL